jgi:UDP-glucose 4-epimerase
MTKVAVTGGAGFIGSNLTKRLLADGHNVVVLDDLSTGLISNIDKSSVQFYEASILDKEMLKKALKDCETIFHFAARGSVPRSIKYPIATHEVNATGTLNVLEIARVTGAHVLFSSSSSVYGKNIQLPKNERMWLGPMSPYAASKLSAEAYVQAYASAYKVPTTLFRFFNVFGPFQRPDHEYAAVIPKWIWLAIQNRPLEVFGDGSASRDFTYIDTVLDIAMVSMKDRIYTDGPVNVAFGNRISLNDILKILKTNFSEIQVEYRESRVSDVKDSQSDPQFLTSLYPNVSPKPFNDALNETINWLFDYSGSA